VIDADYELARGLLDDLLHWRRDVTSGRSSRVIARVLGEQVAPSPTDVGRLGQELFYAGHADAVLGDALAALDRALARVQEPSAGAEIVALRRRCVSAREDLAQIAARNRQVAATRPTVTLPPATGNRPFDVARDAVAYVLSQWRTGFGELAHQCRFAASVSRDVASGDVFQRALVVDALCELSPPWPNVLAPVLTSELAYLLEARRCPVRGWSYYPRLEMIPPDADSLGQILQVVLRLGRHDLSSMFEEPIHQAVHVGALGDGSFATWIVPPRGERTPLQERQAALVSKSADVEVVANLAYALIRFDRSRFERESTSAARWVASRQRASGTWSATWYLGTAYASYVGSRLLAACGRFTEELAAARRHLVSTQDRDGGWGRDGEVPNPLDTALSLLALDAIGGRYAVEPVRARALDFIASFAPDAWPAVPFICQERDDLRPLASRTITAAYVAKAIARCWS
jgi:hypothetical protein